MDGQGDVSGGVSSDIGQFAIVPLWLLEAQVSDRAVRLFAVLAGRYADRKGEAYPSRATLAEALGCSLGSVDRAVDDLVKVGALEITARSGAAGQRSNLFRVFLVQGGGSPVIRGVIAVDQGALITGDQQNHTHVEPYPPSEERRDFLTLSGGDQVVPAPKVRAVTTGFLDSLRGKVPALSDDDFSLSVQACMNHKGFGFQRDKQAYVERWVMKDALKRAEKALVARNGVNQRIRSSVENWAYVKPPMVD